jgi:hypothetical protein
MPSAPSQMRAFRLVPAATGAASNKMDGRVFCTAPEDDIPPLLAYFSFFQAVANIRPPTLPYWISISITIKEDGHKTPEEKAAQSENKFTASTSNIVHKAISRLISNLLQGTDDRNYFNG